MSFVEAPAFLDRPPTPPYVAAARRLLEEVVRETGGRGELLDLAQRTLLRYPAYHQELAENAHRLGADPVHLTLGTLRYDLTIGGLGCSTMVLATPAGPVAARVMDWVHTDRIAQASC